MDLFEGFKDGHNLLSLLEVLSHEALVGVDSNCCCCVPVLLMTAPQRKVYMAAVWGTVHPSIVKSNPVEFALYLIQRTIDKSI